jgi:hypothetical protein
MANEEYQELIAFLGRRFDEIDRRFDVVEAKLLEHVNAFGYPGSLRCVVSAARTIGG